MRKLLPWIVTAIVLFLLWLFRAWWHTPIMFLYSRPEVIQSVIITVLLTLAMSRWPFLARSREYRVTTSTNPPKVSTGTYRLLPIASVAVGVLLLIGFMRIMAAGGAPGIEP